MTPGIPRPAVPARPSRPRRRRERAVTMVEFALVAPFLFIVLLGLIVCGIVATNYVQLSNAVRDGARAAGICGGSSRASGTTLPNGTTCSSSNLTAYIQSRLQAVPAPVTFTVNVLLNGSSLGTNNLDLCSQGATVEVNATFPQPLYLPIVGNLLSNTSNNARTITADAEATCEQ
jgi:Flp pilus assembly protein TadG